MKGCRIDMNNLDVDKRFFKKLYGMSGEWRSLNLMVIKYMKFHKKYVYRCCEITDNQLKDICKIWKNLKSLTKIELDLSKYKTIHLKSDLDCRCDQITNEGLKYLGTACKRLKSLKCLYLNLA